MLSARLRKADAILRAGVVIEAPANYSARLNGVCASGDYRYRDDEIGATRLQYHPSVVLRGQNNQPDFSVRGQVE